MQKGWKGVTSSVFSNTENLKICLIVKKHKFCCNFYVFCAKTIAIAGKKRYSLQQILLRSEKRPRKGRERGGRILIVKSSARLTAIWVACFPSDKSRPNFIRKILRFSQSNFLSYKNLNIYKHNHTHIYKINT